jgi:uncharacterized membrane protein
MTLLHATLVVAAVLCSLVAGFLFAFSVVVMPGIRSLEDAAFIRAFQVIDRLTERNQPLFILVWVCSVLALIAAAVLGFWTLQGVDRLLLVVAAFAYLVGVQVPTAAIHLPLNDILERLDPGSGSQSGSQTGRGAARRGLDSPWNRWNVLTAGWACVVSALLVLLLLRI